MSDWIFRKHSVPRLYKLMLPRVEYLTEKPEWWDKTIPGAFGCFDEGQNVIRLLPGWTWGLFVHEAGHWVLWRLHEWLTAMWEVPWWGFGLRCWLGGKEKIPF